jgi:hypothetical protein
MPMGYAVCPMESSIRLAAGDDLLLPSLYLDSDPPVPRGGFSLT